MSQEIQRHFDEIASDYDHWKQKSHHYHDFLKKFVGEVVPVADRVAEVGCGTGDILAALQPREGLGVDISPAMVAIASRKHPSLRFETHDITTAPLQERFPFVVAVDLVEHTLALDACMRNLAGSLEDGGKLVLTTANPHWRFFLHAAERLKLKMPEGDHRWRSPADLRLAAKGAGLREVSFSRGLLAPKDVPFLRRIDSAGWAEPLRRRAGLVQRAVFVRRPVESL
jgi:SAM-dependent methyltransferase